jgi:hypothetical protein
MAVLLSLSMPSERNDDDAFVISMWNKCDVLASLLQTHLQCLYQIIIVSHRNAKMAIMQKLGDLALWGCSGAGPAHV